MKKIILNIRALFAVLAIVLLSSNSVLSQVPGNACATAVALTSPAIGATITTGAQTTCGRVNDFGAGFSSVNVSYGAGEDAVYSMVVPAGGGNYTFTFANSGATWKVLSIHSACPPSAANTLGGFVTGGATGGTWTGNLPAGTVFIIIDTWPTPNCGAFTLTIRRNTPPLPPCASAINIPSAPVTNQALSCNTTALPGALNATNVPVVCGGATNNYKGGQDAIYTFTPTTTGNYTITYNGVTYSSIFVYSGACPATGGTCVGSVGTAAASQTLTVPMTAGVLYYIWFDTWPAPNSPCPGTFSISTPAPAYNPCTVIPTLSCGVTTNYNMAGSAGAWNTYGGAFPVPGEEKLFAFTPTITGIHNVTVNASAGYVDLFWKAQSLGCNATGWTYVNDILGTETWGINLTAGVTYYLMLDDEDVIANTGTINIACPTPCSGTLVTLNMTDTWGDGWENAEMRLISSTGTVFGPYTLAGGFSGLTQICLPNDCYRIVLTAGTTPSEIGWSLTNGATTYASAASPNAAPFNTFFTIGGVSCPAAPSNDLCANAPIFDLGANPNQTHTGTGIGSTNTLGLTQHSQTWVRIVVPCGGMNVSMNFCSSTPARNNAFINLFSDCGAAPVLSTATNWNFTSCTNGSITLNWNNLAAGTYYYPILIDNIAWPGAYTLNISGTALHTPATAPTSISGTTSVCSGQSTTLTLQGGSAGTNGTVQWFEGSCGSAVIGTANSITVAPTTNTTYFVRYISSCNTTACASVSVNLNSASTEPTLSGAGLICPNTTVNLVASGGTVGTGSQVAWYTGPNGTGTFLGFGNSFSFLPSASSTVYARREGTCNTTADASTSITMRDYVYAANNISSTTYCTDNAGWNHFYNGNDIILSVRGNLSSAGTVTALIRDNAAYFTDPGNTALCASGINPGEAQFEMQRSWNVSYTGTLSGTYQVRYYFAPQERQDVIDAATAFMAANPSCAYTYKYNAGNSGWFWFKNNNVTYAAPSFDDNPNFALLTSTAPGTTPNGLTYTEISNITGFSGGTGGVVLIPGGFLPVEWLYFNAENQGNANRLLWATASEENALSFDVERSKDGSNFEKIGTKTAAGNSSVTNYYEFMDNNPQNGFNYYRIKLINTDGTEEFTEVKVLENKFSSDDFAVYPNPTSDIIHFNSTADKAEDMKVEVLDILGRVVKTEIHKSVIGKNNVPLRIAELQAGAYSLRVTFLQSNRTNSAKFVKK